MVKQVTLRKVGGAVVASIPKAMLDALQLREGDTLFAVQTGDGILLTPHDPEFEDAMKAFERINRMYRDALRELAKR